MEITRKRFVPYWLRKREPELQKNVLTIIDRCNAIRRLIENGNSGEESDLEAARINLRDTLTEILETGDVKNNPLWDAIMTIRPRVIDGRLPTSVTEEVAEALWDRKNEAKEPMIAEFFGKLAGRLRRHQINFFRATIAGGPLVAKEKTGEWRTHYFSGIPFNTRPEAGVKLSTAPENVEAVVKAYQLMARKTAGHAKTALEAVIADITELSNNLYPPKK